MRRQRAGFRAGSSRGRRTGVERNCLQTPIGHNESELATVVDHFTRGLRKFLSMKAVETINNMRTGETLTMLE
jgi:hypothetical protein